MQVKLINEKVQISLIGKMIYLTRGYILLENIFTSGEVCLPNSSVSNVHGFRTLWRTRWKKLINPWTLQSTNKRANCSRLNDLYMAYNNHLDNSILYFNKSLSQMDLWWLMRIIMSISNSLRGVSIRFHCLLTIYYWLKMTKGCQS